MTIEEVKEWLNRPSKIKLKLRYLNIELDRYESQIYSCSHQVFDVERVDGSRNTETPNQRALEKYYEVKDIIKSQEVQLENVINEIETEGNKLLKDEHKIVLKLRYIDGLTFPEIANKVFLAESTVKRIHRESLIGFVELKKT